MMSGPLPRLWTLKSNDEIHAKPIREDRWPNWLFKLTPTLRLVPSSRFAPYGAA
jgi:hypothetical protein